MFCPQCFWAPTRMTKMLTNTIPTWLTLKTTLPEVSEGVTIFKALEQMARAQQSLHRRKGRHDAGVGTDCSGDLGLTFLTSVSLVSDWNHHVPGPSGEQIKAVFSPGRKNTQMGILEVVNSLSPAGPWAQDQKLAILWVVQKHPPIQPCPSPGETGVPGDSLSLWLSSISSSGGFLWNLERMSLQTPPLQKGPACLEQRGENWRNQESSVWGTRAHWPGLPTAGVATVNHCCALK